MTWSISLAVTKAKEPQVTATIQPQLSPIVPATAVVSEPSGVLHISYVQQSGGTMWQIMNKLRAESVEFFPLWASITCQLGCWAERGTRGWGTCQQPEARPVLEKLFTLENTAPSWLVWSHSTSVSLSLSPSPFLCLAVPCRLSPAVPCSLSLALWLSLLLHFSLCVSISGLGREKKIIWPYSFLVGLNIWSILSLLKKTKTPAKWQVPSPKTQRQKSSRGWSCLSLTLPGLEEPAFS